MKKNTIARAVSSAVFATLASVPSLVNAEGMVLEEVIVTAQKRAESLQDVPVAITAVTGDNLRSAGIDKLETLAPSIPSFHVGEAFGGSDQMWLRGLGSGVNFGFEMAVGQVVDGFYYGRSRFGRSQFLDIARVEVLKGPQGAIIGKNTTAGAINITTAKPTQEFEGWVSAAAQFEGGDGATFEGAISGPLTDSLSGRVALRYEDRDGYVENLTNGEDDQSVDDYSGRVSLLFEPSDTFNAAFQYGTGDFERTGRNMEATECDVGPTTEYRDFLAANNVTNQDCKLNYTRPTVVTKNGVGDLETQETEFNTAGLTLNWVFDNFTISSLTGYADYDFLDTGENDRTQVEFLTSDLGEEYEQFSQEFRIVSAGGERFDYIAGFFYQETEQDTFFDLQIANVRLPDGGKSRRIETHQEGETIAVFGNLTWHLGEKWDVTVEGRFTSEDKDAEQIQQAYDIYTDDVCMHPACLGGEGGPAGVFNRHTVEGDRSEDNFSPGLILEWHPNDDFMYYASLKRGFKGGGFDHQLVAGTATPQSVIEERFQFEEEEVSSVELGGKLTLADGAARLNFALFYNEFDDLQVSSLIGPATFDVGNAASATTMGVEADLEWRLIESLTWVSSVGFLNAEYDDYDGPCNEFQNLHGICPNPIDGTQSLDGKTLQFAPEWSYSTSLEYVLPLGDNLEFISFVQVYGEDEKALALDLDPSTWQDSYTKVDARFTLASTSGMWEVSLIGRNLTDEDTRNFANDIPTFEGSYFSLIEPPRTYTLKATLRF